MTPALRSPSTRTLGSQFVVISTVLALIARIFLTASRPMPVIATSRSATTAVILVRMEYLANMAGISYVERIGASDVVEIANQQRARPSHPTPDVLCPR